jgi:MFS family permease
MASVGVLALPDRSRASSIVTTTTRFSTTTLDDPFASTDSIDIDLGGRGFHITRTGSRIFESPIPSYSSLFLTSQGGMATQDAIARSEPEHLVAMASTGTPQDQLEISEPTNTDEDDRIYPSGAKFYLSISSLLLTQVFVGLDMTIVAVVVPSLTDYFKSIDDIGWYSSAYMLFYCCFIFMASQLYLFFSVKTLYLSGITIFQLGSLLCTIAPRSGVFILGRAVAGVGACITGVGNMIIVTYSIPRPKRPLWMGVFGATNSIAMVSAPLIGGALVDAFSWRACFGINLPCGAVTLALTAYAFQNPVESEHSQLPLKEKLQRMDLVGTFLFIPAIVCLLIGLQWGGVKYGWTNAVIIVCFVVFAVLISMFIIIQWRAKEAATIPPRIIKQRSVLSAALFTLCCNGILATVEYYVSIYFQGVRGFSATKSGALGVPLIVGLLVAGLAAGVVTTAIGYYYPSMICTSIIAPIATGLLTTLDLDESLVKVLCLLGLLGVGVGLGLQAPVVAVQNVLPAKDIAIGIAVTGFAGSLGSAFSICISSVLFQSRLSAEIARHSPSVNMTAFDHGGLTDVRKYIGEKRLRDVLLGYDNAVSQTLYIPVGLAVLTMVGSLAMERKSVKKKRS